MPRILVMGLGNVLVGDDGAGAWAVERLRCAWSFPPDVDVLEAGTPGLELVGRLAASDTVVVLDALRAAGIPGEVRIYDGAAIVESPDVRISTPHDPGLKEALLLLEFSGEAPARLYLVGVVPQRVEPGVGLTPAVDAAVPRMVDAAVGLLRDLGVAVSPREPPESFCPWWLK